MEVVIPDEFYKKLSPEQRRTAVRTVDKIKKAASEDLLPSFLLSHNSKILKGSKGVRFKFKVSDSERISFVYAYEGSNGFSDCIIIEKYLTHDDQSRSGRTRNVVKREETETIHSSNDLQNMMSIDDNQDNIFDVYSHSICHVHTEEEIRKDEKYFENDGNDNDINGRNLENREAQLSVKQSQLLRSWNAEFPFFVSGCAGSGKSLIALHILDYYRNQIKPLILTDASDRNSNVIAHFTLSDGLKEQAEKQYRIIHPDFKYPRDDVTVRFENLTRYCVKEVKVQMNKVVAFELFNSEFLNMYYKRKSLIEGHNISPIEIWKEIRGSIKGYMGEYWSKKKWLNRLDFDVNTVEFLQNTDVFTACPENSKRFFIKDPYLKTFIKLKSKLNLYKSYDKKRKDIICEDLEKMYNFYRKVDIKDFAMTRAEYLDFSEGSHVYGNKHGEDVYNKDERSAIYDLFKEYENWLKNNKYFDENDLAVKLLNMYKPEFNIDGKEDKSTYPFDLIVLDEIQDLTQLQIYTVYHLVKEKARIVFAGDEHQIINPTMFARKDIYTLFLTDQKTAKKVNLLHLRSNFRSQKNIIDLANHMSEIRREHIAKTDDETEQDIEAERTDNDCKPFCLCPSEENISKMIRSLKKYPDTAIIVADEKNKMELVGKYGEGQIFTVQEIKGLEFKYVFCYDLLGEYRKIWEEIFSTGKAKNNSRYRYYFNLFYVAITRSKDYLCLLDKKAICSDLEKEIMPYLKEIDDFNSDNLYITGLIDTSEAWYESAEELEKSGLYEEAILQYKKSNERSKKLNTEIPIAILRCQAKLLAKQNKFKEAWFLAVEIDDYNLALTNADSLGDEKLVSLTKKLQETPDQKIQIKERERFYDMIAHATDNQGGRIFLLEKYFDDLFVNKIGERVEWIGNRYKQMTEVNSDGKD
ncbi:MAG: UvrD-helicase domain-containing protein [Synergistaceae bacterium]|nr:UvrD-helicase domain-containing protein [Synergistaceae bacterium]